MFTAYIKYISLLLFSGLILTFYRAAAPSACVNVKAFNGPEVTRHIASFSLLNDVILPYFPVLNTPDLLRGNKK